MGVSNTMPGGSLNFSSWLFTLDRKLLMFYLSSCNCRTLLSKWLCSEQTCYSINSVKITAHVSGTVIVKEEPKLLQNQWKVLSHQKEQPHLRDNWPKRAIQQRFQSPTQKASIYTWSHSLSDTFHRLLWAWICVSPHISILWGNILYRQYYPSNFNYSGTLWAWDLVL